MKVIAQILPAIPLSMMKDKSSVVLVITGHGMNQIEAVREIVVRVNHFAITVADAIAIILILK